ncbi:pentatricopeptide repeat-containing protein [Panicum miliaceum]|uniref:Pentatricopeptide repeat-containing protein n=1 Tax=Panicum miliaceum TaxID=4540 RepID=A0A3L6PQC2_PANMI|nr:pentatricopeptide repeat-containing protein [Panicum miliaceum]
MPPGLAAPIRCRRLSTAAASMPLSSLTDALLATRLATHLLAVQHQPTVPLPVPVHLHIFRHPALPPASKLSFFLTATPPASPLLASTFPALLRALSAGSPTLLDELLPFTLSCPSPAALLPALLTLLSPRHASME